MLQEPLRVTKIAAAEGQLREAILLFFERRDQMAIHTLAAAAQQILVDLAKASGHASLMKDSPYVKPEMQKKWARRLNAPQNFFKHADRDPEEVLDFYPSTTEFYLADAAHLFGLLEDRVPHVQAVFKVWFSIANPHLLVDGPYKAKSDELLASGVDPQNYPLFLAFARGGSGL